MIRTTLFRASFALLYLAGIISCETPDDNKIEQARQCSDNDSQLAQTNPSEAATIATLSCEPLIANIQTVEAGLIGVGLVLIEEQKLSNLTAVENAVNAGSNAIATSISFLVFLSPVHVTNLTRYAALSTDPGSQELSSIVALAYYANVAAAGGLSSSSTPAQVAGYITTLASDPVNGPPAAQALLTAQANACAGGSTSTLCTDLTNAIGGATTTNAILTNAAAYIAAGG